MTKARRTLRRPIVYEGGGVVITRRGAEFRFLLVRSSDQRHWLFPKGHVEPGETTEQAAVREVREEAGVEARVLASLGTGRFSYGGRTIAVRYHLLECLKQGQPAEKREARWCTFETASRLLSFPETRRLAARAKAVAQRLARP